jgi:hypothetical protein
LIGSHVHVHVHSGAASANFGTSASGVVRAGAIPDSTSSGASGSAKTKDEGSGVLIFLTIGLSAGLLLLGFVGGVVFLSWRRRNRLEGTSENEEEELPIPEPVTTFTNDTLDTFHPATYENPDDSILSCNDVIELPEESQFG